MGFGGLDTDIQFVKGVGPSVGKLYEKLGIRTVGDLLYHLPRRYEDRTQLPPIASLRPGMSVTVRGSLTSVHSKPIGGGRVIVKATITDRRYGLNLIWFNQPWIKRKLESYIGGEVIAYGMVKEGNSYLEMASPEFELVDEDKDVELFAQITPVYPLTEGLYQGMVRRAVDYALTNFLDSVPEALPAKLRERARLPGIRWALEQIHRPSSHENKDSAKRRLVFEEFFCYQCAMEMKKARTKKEDGIAFEIQDALWEEVRNMVPFKLTDAQTRVISEIWEDMKQPHPMNRLVQGDVGSGKTLVAAAAILAAVRSGYQAALMAPTEILAEQHALTLKRLLEPLGITVAVLLGKQGARERKVENNLLKQGLAQVAVGTHALIQEGVEFSKLGLAIVDEQHRFGVLQRAALKEKGFGNPDVLVMTATPIPRTLTMTTLGDLDRSEIDQLPPNRSPIITEWKKAKQRDEVYEQIRKFVKEGNQVYIVCPLVEESEKMQAQAAEATYFRLANQVFPDFRLGLLHGQMKAAEKAEVMEAFRTQQLDILVATTVIEVGVDVPNATVMLIEDANRFGLAQLHQLRGRVGRGAKQSYCILLGDATSEDARKRLQIMVDSTDGFKIAEVDLDIRGPGEVTGTKQSGKEEFKVASIVEHKDILEESSVYAKRLIKNLPDLNHPEYALLRERALEIIRRRELIESS
jgi:ATP-dependent DNA helicase RecG